MCVFFVCFDKCQFQWLWWKNARKIVFGLRGASCSKVFPCSLSSCFFVPFSTAITSFGEEGAGTSFIKQFSSYELRKSWCWSHSCSQAKNMSERVKFTKQTNKCTRHTDLGPVSLKVVRRIFVVNSSYFQLLYIRFTKLVRRKLFDETGPSSLFPKRGDRNTKWNEETRG